MIFKKYIRLKNKKLKKDPNIRHRNVSYKNATKVGLIFTHDSIDKISRAEELNKLFLKDGKTVKIMAYKPVGQVNHLPYDTFTNKDITFWGKYTRSNVNNFIEQEFDFLFCIDDEPDLIIENIIALSKARCRVGKLNNNQYDLFELMIGPGIDSNWLNGMYDYVKRIH
jgi:hypothetical protein